MSDKEYDEQCDKTEEEDKLVDAQIERSINRELYGKIQADLSALDVDHPISRADFFRVMVIKHKVIHPDRLN